MIDLEQLQSLTKAAQQAAKNAYNPYSHFAVGCGLLSKTGKIYQGANIENASFSVTLCAERVAASQAIFEGNREWVAMVVVSPQRVSPCGVCRQFLYEFAPELPVWYGYLDNMDLIGPISLGELLPAGMTLAPVENPKSS